VGMIAIPAIVILMSEIVIMFQVPKYRAPVTNGASAMLSALWRSPMRILENSAFGAVALIAQALVIAAILVA
jgi:hypothetical protein